MGGNLEHLVFYITFVLGLMSTIAEIAQLVEHNLAKVRVAGSSPVFRSFNTMQHSEHSCLPGDAMSVGSFFFRGVLFQ